MKTIPCKRSVKKYYFKSMPKLLFRALLAMLPGSGLFAQEQPDTVIVVPIKTAPPANIYKLGSIKAGNNATQTHCDYEEVISEAKDKARAMGGNVVKITGLIAPALISKCYKIKADVYNAGPFRDSVIKQMKVLAPKPGLPRPHATLYLYRLKDTTAFTTAYYLHLNKDSVICKVKSSSYDEVYLYNEGPATIWAQTETRKELKLDVKNGEIYYIRCGLVKGSIRNVPVIELVDKHTGEAEFKKQAGKEKNSEVKYLQQVH